MDYFKHISCHVQGEMDVDAVTTADSQTKVISIGCDDLIKWRNISGVETQQKQLPPDQGFNKIALHPSGGKFLVGGESKRVEQYSMATKDRIKIIHESFGAILDMKYSPSGRYISIATQQQKITLIDTENNRSTKCRPGHSNRVLNTFFSSNDRYVSSIGQDSFVLIYELSADKDPKQVYRTTFTYDQVPFGVQGCFFEMKQGYKVFVPGTVELQIIQQLSNRWEIKKTNIAHSGPILIAQAITQYHLITSCIRDMCIWNLQTQQKLIVLQDFPFTKIIPLPHSFIGNRNDGSIYFYDRPLPKIQAEQQEEGIQAQQNESRIQFEGQNEGQQNIELQYENEQQQQQQEQYQQRKASKRRIADRIIKTAPQQQLSRATTYFNDNKFLYTNLHGCIVQSIQVEQTSTTAQFYRHNEQPFVKQLFKNKQIRYADMDSKTVCYANQSQFGVKIDRFLSWEKDWFDIQGIAFGGTWLAVANTSQIKFMDISGNQIKSVCFDRPIIAMQAYQNLLAVLYHESVPLYENQMLSMKIFTVKQFQVLNIAETHVPLTTLREGQKGTTLRWFGFSNEGMIFSQDSKGQIRAYSLETNEWTLLYTDAASDPKKIWIIGINNYELVYWKTTDQQPEPTVRPRLNIKTAKLATSILAELSQQTKQLPYLMWQRYCLDHELARFRLWSRNKQTRNQKHVNYHKSKTIMNQKQIYDRNLNLDVEFYSIIKAYLKDKNPEKASNLTKAYIRSIQAGRNLIQLFDDSGYRNLAIDLQYFYDEKEKDVEYQAMQELQLRQLKSKVQISVKPKRENPMNPKFKRPLKDSIPYHISSQSSQNSSITIENITNKTPENSKIQQVYHNPCLKKSSTGDSRKQEIQEQIQKYGVKKKVEEKKKNRV